MQMEQVLLKDQGDRSLIFLRENLKRESIGFRFLSGWSEWRRFLTLQTVCANTVLGKLGLI